MKIRPQKLFSFLIAGAVVAGFCATARPFSAIQSAVEAPRSSAAVPQEEETAPEKKLVYMRADDVYSIAVGDSMATCMVGNFAALHNGAVITCDSAVRYDGQTLECFGNVLINQNTTYIYGDRADYRGRQNKAEVYSPLVKVVDGDATLYTHRFSFDTYAKVGEFSQGGVLFNRGNQLEADRGYYFTQSHELACVGHVEMRDSTYLLRSDSVSYNTDLDRADFFRDTHIWNDTGDYLSGDSGSYDRAANRYLISSNGYILTPKEEIWGDSLDYRRDTERAYLYGNIQLDDTEHKTMGFGDYGEYWREPGSALLTRNPALVSYDTSQGDSIFMRSDTILLLTNYTTRPEFNPWVPQVSEPDSLAREISLSEEDAPTAAASTSESVASASSEEESPTPTPAASQRAENSREAQTAPSAERSEGAALGGASRTGALDSVRARQMERHRNARGSLRDSLRGPVSDSLRTEGGVSAMDSLGVDSLQVDGRDSLQRLTDSLDTLSVKARKAYYKRVAREERAAEKAKKMQERREKLKIIARARQAKITAQLNRMDSLEKVRLERRRARIEAKLQAKRERAIRRGKELPDSSALRTLDSLLEQRSQVDSTAVADSLSMPVDSLAADSLLQNPVDSAALLADTIRRVTYGYRNVKIYRSDFQAVCDSIVGLGVDSTLHLYVDPILWNQNNQLSSEVMDVYSQSGSVDHIDFVGRPIMISEIDSAYFNQISGKEMTAWFAQNEIYRHDVNGNVETIYFLQDDPEEPVNSLFVVQSGTASFYMEQKQIVTMTYREQNEYSMFPIDKVPENQALFLKEYKWSPERRPSRDSVFTRTIRPSQREKSERMTRPEFPLAARIMSYRDHLIESGRWADRDEVLSPDVQEWVRRNGFEPSAPRKEM